MGSGSLEGMRPYLNLDDLLAWHLQYNHYPPVDLRAVPIAKQAIEKVNNDEGSDTIVAPSGRRITYWDVVEQLHLESFLDTGENDGRDN